MKTLRELLTEYNIEEGYSTDDSSLEETLREAFPIVYKGDAEEHRWRIEYNYVCKIDNRFFCYTEHSSKSERCCGEDVGYFFEGIDNVPEVYPHEVKTIEYRLTKDENNK